MMIRKCRALLLAGGAAIALFLLCLGPQAVLAYPAGPEAAPANAPHAAIDAPSIRIKRDANPAYADIYWKHVIGTEFYEVYRSTQPYLEPGVAPTNRIKDIDAGPFGDGSTVTYPDTGVDNYPGDGTIGTVQVIGNPSTNYFWVVQGRSGGDVSGASNLVGEFDFALVKGS